MIFPAQKLDSSKKDEKWGKASIDYIISEGHNELIHDVARMLGNYRLVNSQMDEEEFRALCKTLGVSESIGKKYIGMYNKTPNIISTLKGEELNRPSSWSVYSITEQPDNKYTLEQERMFISDMDKVFSSELKKTIDLIKKEVELEVQGIPEQERKQQIEQIQKEMEEKYSTLLDNNFQDRYKDVQTEKEKAVSNLLKIAFNRIDHKWIKNECFYDVATAGKEMVEIRFENDNPIPQIRQLNPLNVFYHKSPDTPFIHDSDYAGYQEELTIGQVLDLYGNRLNKKDIKRIQVYAYDGSGKYGTSDTMFHTRSDRHASSWAAKTDAGMYPSGYNLDPAARVLDSDGRHMGVPNSIHGTGNNIYGPGLYAGSRRYNGRFISVYTVYWKSYRKVYKYSYTDQYGEIAEEIVPEEDFVLPDNANKETYKDTPFGEYKTRHVWYDEDDNYNSVEEIWIPEIWRGVRINGDIYVDIGPLEHAYQSLMNPYKTKLPILGYVFNSRNSGILSIADRLQPWQKLYYSIMARLIKSIAQDKGVITFLNSLMVSDEVGLKKTLAMAEDGNIVPYNPLAYTKSTGVSMNTMKAAERIDATNAEVVQYYIRVLEFIELQMTESVGMSPQRLAKASGMQDTATDNQRQTQHSMNITEPLFYAHDLLWEKIGQSYMEMLVSSVSESTGKIRGLLDDKKIAVVDLNMISLEDEYLYKISNNIKNNRVLDIIKSQVHALIQNDKAKLSTLLSMLKSEDIHDMEEEILQFEARMEELEDRREQARRDQEKEIERMRIEQREDEQISDLQREYLSSLMKRNTDIEKEHIRGKYTVTSYNLQNDKDADGIPDLMEADLKYKKFLNDIAEKEQKITAEMEKLQMEKEKIKQDMQQHKDRIEIEKAKIKASKKAENN